MKKKGDIDNNSYKLEVIQQGYLRRENVDFIGGEEEGRRFMAFRIKDHRK